jgi:hypothetical protein
MHDLLTLPPTQKEDNSIFITYLYVNGPTSLIFGFFPSKTSSGFSTPNKFIVKTLLLFMSL